MSCYSLHLWFTAKSLSWQEQENERYLLYKGMKWETYLSLSFDKDMDFRCCLLNLGLPNKAIFEPNVLKDTDLKWHFKTLSPITQEGHISKGFWVWCSWPTGPFVSNFPTFSSKSLIHFFFLFLDQLAYVVECTGKKMGKSRSIKAFTIEWGGENQRNTVLSIPYRQIMIFP